MVSNIARTTEYMTVTVVVLLAASCLLSACSSTPAETTSSIARAPAPVYNTPPPVIHGAASMPTGQPVAYAPSRQRAYAPRHVVVCRPVGAQKYDREITASIPRSQPAQSRAPRMSLLAHIIEPRETMNSISRRYHTRSADIAAINRINADSRLRSGEILVVPVYR